jgi:hypothetical protein
MRHSILIAAYLVGACAHRDPRHMRESAQDAQYGPTQLSAVPSPPERKNNDVRGRTAPILRDEHPPTELPRDKPPAHAAARPTALPDTSANFDGMAPPPAPAAEAAPIQIEPTAGAPPLAAVPPSKPASPTRVNNPLDERKPPPRLGSDIATADAELRERIQRALLQRSDLSYTARHARVKVEDRNVTVEGQARTEHERAEVEELIRGLRGVRDFKSELVVINTPPGPQ